MLCQCEWDLAGGQDLESFFIGLLPTHLLLLPFTTQSYLRRNQTQRPGTQERCGGGLSLAERSPELGPASLCSPQALSSLGQ